MEVTVKRESLSNWSAYPALLRVRVLLGLLGLILVSCTTHGRLCKDVRLLRVCGLHLMSDAEHSFVDCGLGMPFVSSSKSWLAWVSLAGVSPGRSLVPVKLLSCSGLSFPSLVSSG